MSVARARRVATSGVVVARSACLLASSACMHDSNDRPFSRPIRELLM
jgi:hypothetical protein